MKRIVLFFLLTLLVAGLSTTLTACGFSHKIETPTVDSIKNSKSPVDKTQLPKYKKKVFKSGDKVSYAVFNHNIPFRVSFTVPKSRGKKQIKVTHTPSSKPGDSGDLKWSGVGSSNNLDSSALEGYGSLDTALDKWLENGLSEKDSLLKEGGGKDTTWRSKISDFWVKAKDHKFTDFVVISKILTSTGKDFFGDSVNVYYGLEFSQHALGPKAALELANSITIAAVE